jgi:hypothetical protein
VNAAALEASRHRPLLAIMDGPYRILRRERSTGQSDAERQSEPAGPVWPRPLALFLPRMPTGPAPPHQVRAQRGAVFAVLPIRRPMGEIASSLRCQRETGRGNRFGKREIARAPERAASTRSALPAGGNAQ